MPGMAPTDTATTEATARSDIAEVIPGRLDVDEVLDLVPRAERPAAPAALTGELVAPADELVQAFAATLVARPQTQRTYERACRRFARWLGPLAGPEDLTACRAITRTWSPAGAPARRSRRTALP
jgi:hypothetical protein